MRAVLIAVAALLAAPALAQSSKMEQPPAKAEAFRPPPAPPSPVPQGTPVVVDRDTLMRQLAGINEKLAQATGRAKKDKQLLKLLDSARAELKDVGRQVTNAPPARTEPQRPPPPPPQPAVQPITQAMLRSLVAAIRNEPFAEDQLAVLEEAVPTQYFLVAQAQEILHIFRFSKDRLKAVRLLRPRLLDVDNSFELYEAFQFSNDKDELKRILAAPTP